MLNKILSGGKVGDIVLSESLTDLTEMANVVGKKVKTDDIDFSFYFSNKSEVNHGIRVKVKWNKDHLAGGTDGYFELHGDYAWVQSGDGKIAKQSEIESARRFFKKYKVLFAAVWENCLDANDVQDYFRGLISFLELLKAFLINADFKGVRSLSELDKFVREKRLFNLND